VEKPRQPKLLIVFFSRTGTTRRLAEHIARATGADVEELKESRSRGGILGWLRSGYEGTYRRSAQILPLRRRLSDYDLVFIGSPTWNRALASPVRGFLEQYSSALPSAALFATCQGRGASDVIEQMAALLKEPPLATLAMLESDVQSGPAVQVGELSEAALVAWEKKRNQKAR
jgi:flavodoxin